MRQRCPSLTQPRFVLRDATFELRRLCMAWIMAYIDLALIGGIVGFLKLSTSLLTEVATMVGGKE